MLTKLLDNIKNLVTLIVMLGVIYSGYKVVEYLQGVSKENQRLHEELVSKSTQFKKLNDHVALLEIKYKTQEALKKETELKFKNEAKELKDRIKILSQATFLIRERAKEQGNSDVVYSGNYLKYVINEVSFNNGPPLGYVLIFDDGSVVSKLYEFQVNVDQVVTRNESSGIYKIASKADLVLKTPDLKGQWYDKPYPLTINSGTATIDPTEKNQTQKRFKLWAPHVNAGISMVAGSENFLRPTLDFSFSGYGVTKNDLDFKILHLGLDTDSQFDEVGMHITPFSYRFLPKILSNTYLGPSIGKTKNGYNLQLNLNLTL